MTADARIPTVTEAFAAEPAPRKVWDVARVASGNFLEMYDFMVFGYFAGPIGDAFFPHGDAFARLLAALATFGAGFLMRPFGAVVLGAFTDRHGRRAGLLLTLLLMGVGILTLTLTPSVSWWSAHAPALAWLAPVLVLAGRLVQGFSAGAELGNVSVYLSEIAPQGRRGFYVSWQSASQQVAVMTAAALGFAVAAVLPPDAVHAWGWRVPLGVGCLIVPLLLVMRRTLRETQSFAARTHTPPVGELLAGLARGWRPVLAGVALTAMTTVSFYTITAYTPSFGKILGLSAGTTLAVTAAVGLSNLVWLPVMGAWSDRIGRKPLLIGCTVLAILTAYPAMRWLAAAPSFGKLLAVELWLSALYASYNSAMVVFLTEIVPAKVRASGFSLAYSLATALGGFAPYIATWLIRQTGDRAIPGAWLTAAAVAGLSAALLTPEPPGGRPRANGLSAPVCFSAQADFTAAAVVGAAGVATLMQVRRPRAILFASLPLLFAAHQATEGVVWLGADRLVSPDVTRGAMLAFMLYAQALLPLLVAVGVWLIEPSPRRRRWIAATVAAAAVLCVLGCWGLASAHSTVTVQGRCLAFRNPVTNHPWYAAAYALPATAPLLSSRPWVRAFGALNLAGMAVVLAVRAYALTSVWCLYAAALSVMIYWAVRREEAPLEAPTLTFPQPRPI